MRNENEGVIRADELYAVKQFKLRLGIKDAAMRSLRKSGLPSIRIGNRVFYSGRQVLEFMEGLATNDKRESESGQAQEPQTPSAPVARSDHRARPTA